MFFRPACSIAKSSEQHRHHIVNTTSSKGDGAHDMGSAVLTLGTLAHTPAVRSIPGYMYM